MIVANKNQGDLKLSNINRLFH